MIMIIESKPYYQTRKYFGNIEIPELTNADGTHIISFTIEIREVEDFNLESRLVGTNYSVHPTIKNKQFESFRGTELRLISSRILEEIKNRNIVL